MSSWGNDMCVNIGAADNVHYALCGLKNRSCDAVIMALRRALYSQSPCKQSVIWAAYPIPFESSAQIEGIYTEP